VHKKKRLAIICGFTAQYPTAVQILYSYKVIHKYVRRCLCVCVCLYVCINKTSKTWRTEKNTKVIQNVTYTTAQKTSLLVDAYFHKYIWKLVAAIVFRT